VAEPFTVTDASARPDLVAQADALVAANLPPFMMWESPGNWRWHRVYSLFPHEQVFVTDGSGALVAALHAVPTAWSGAVTDLPAGYDDVLVQATADDAPPATALCLLSMSICPHLRGQGLSAELLGGARARAAKAGYGSVIAPLRPTRKAHYPDIDIEAYAAWTDDEGEAFDPWLRTHLRLGGTVLAMAPSSLVVRQPVKRWEAAVGITMQAPGRYRVPGALAEVVVDSTGNAVYAEPNIWVLHQAGP